MMARGIRHKKTPESAKLVCALAQYGVTKKSIAMEMGISFPTFEKHYADDYALGAAKAEILAKKTLFEMAVKERQVAPLLFSLKARFGMCETSQVEISGGMELKWQDE